jgi:hypothetical protein
VGRSGGDLAADAPQIAQRSPRFEGDPEELGELADQHDQRDAVHVTVADRLREQLRDEAQAEEAGEDAREPETRAMAPARATARAGSPADSGTTTEKIRAARDESGPRTRMRLGPNRA